MATATTSRSTRSTSSTSSRSDARSASRDRTAAKALRPFTIDHFRRYASLLILDNGERWEVEDFQALVLEDVFAGHPENWMVVPEGNGKTTLMGGLALYHADHTPTAAVLMAAASRDQCGLLLGQAAGFVYRTPGLKDARFRVFEGYRRIVATRTRGRIQVFAADDRTGDGVIPTLGLLDELHRHPDMRLYRTWRGKLDKRDGQLVAISTAGEPGSEFETTRERVKIEGSLAMDGQHIRASSGDMVLHEWALRPDQDRSDLRLVKAANPFSGITEDKLERRRSSPAMTASHWARFVCNVAIELDGCWLPDGAWAACEDPEADIPDGAPVCLGVDVGLKKDTTAIVRAWKRDDDRVVVKADVILPPGDGTPLDLSMVEDRVREMADRYEVTAVAYDPWNFERSAQILSDDGLLMVEFPQRLERMVKVSGALYEAILSGEVAHDGDPVLAAHVAAGHQKMTDRGWRLVKNPKRNRPIDALIALAMAYSLASTREPTATIEFW